MNRTQILISLFISIVFISCQKEVKDILPATTVSTSKVKTYTEDVTSPGGHSVITFNLAYDANDRPVSMISATSAGDKFLYQYATGSYTMDLFNSNVLSIHEIFYTNSNSLVDSTLQYNDTHDTTTEKYLYNNAGQLIAVKHYDYSRATGSVLFNTDNYTYDSNGNVAKFTDNNGITSFGYYTNLVNNLSFGPPYFPLSKNLVKTTIFNSGGTPITLNHTYTFFDTNNRITTEKVIYDSGEIVIKTYTYY